MIFPCSWLVPNKRISFLYLCCCCARATKQENWKFILDVFLAEIDLIHISVRLSIYIYKNNFKILWQSKCHCTHSPLPLAEPLDTIVNTRERQSPTIFIADSEEHFKNSLQKAYTILNPSSGNSYLSSPVAL